VTARKRTVGRLRKPGPFDCSECRSPTPEQLRIKALADAISALMTVPSERDSASCAYLLACELIDCVAGMVPVKMPYEVFHKLYHGMRVEGGGDPRDSE